MTDDATLHALYEQKYLVEAAANPWSPTSVPSFFFAVDYADEAAVAHGLREGHSVMGMKRAWFFGASIFDDLCRPFRDVSQAAGAGELTGAEWNTSVDGKMAQLILCDQISRNAFRGSRQAFAGDERGELLARELSLTLLSDGSQPSEGTRSSETRLTGEFFPAYFIFLLTASMHSELVEDHLQMARVLDHADAHSPPLLHDWFRMMRQGGESHTRVVQRFGRYPHRNASLGRTDTEEEAAWLADIDNLPGWAKSQMSAG